MKGYISEEHKRTFTITAFVLAGVFFIVQFVLPYVIMFASMPSMFFNPDWMKFAILEESVLWRGQIWYLEESFEGFGGQVKNNLMTLKIGGEGPVVKKEISMKNPLLLADEDKLWIMSSFAIVYYDDKDIKFIAEFIHEKSPLGDISSPFIYRGNPALIEKSSSNLNLIVFDGKEWTKERTLISDIADTLCYYFREEIKIISQDNEIYSFLKFGETLYYRKGLPPDEENDFESWEPVCAVGLKWYPTFTDKTPAVFFASGNEGFNEELKGIRLSNGIWEEIFSYKTPLLTEFAVHSIDTNKFVLLTQMFPGSFKAIEVEGNEVLEEIRYGGSPFFPTKMMGKFYLTYVLMIFMPLVLALILSGLMQKYRITQYEEKDKTVRFASLAKRTFAQVIDGTIAGAPLIIGFLIMMPDFFDLERMFFILSPENMLLWGGVILGGLFWALLWLFIFSFTEGKYGKTPGKWLFRIKVLGMDLAPCGFGRALIRNVLEPVDAFFNFMVGIMLIAFTENWQRIGDMLAKTIVVEDRD